MAAHTIFDEEQWPNKAASLERRDCPAFGFGRHWRGVGEPHRFRRMTVGQLLDDIRDKYLSGFRECIAEVKEGGCVAMCESAIRDQDGALAREGAFGLSMRLDIVAIADDEVKDTIRVESGSMIAFEPIDFEWTGGLPTRLAPFVWDACDIRAYEIPESPDWSHVREWFQRWFDGEDTYPADEHGLHGVIHFLSDPKREGAVTIIQIDFGSAPVEAFEELLDALRDSGASKIEIGQDEHG